MRVSGGYWVVVTTLEAFRLQGPNVVSFQLETGGQHEGVGRLLGCSNYSVEPVLRGRHPLLPKGKHFTLEAFRLQGPNVVSFQLETGGQRWHVVGFYIAPDNALTIEDVITVTIKWFRGADILVAGDFNADLAEPERNTRN